MGSQSPDGQQPATSSERIQVEDASGRRPFMRGILIHSLMAQGVGYEDAYRAANAVRERIGSQGVV
ncbi:MAG: hypothetical protein ABFS46_10635, partial [Myxococcota bacterium]